LSRPFPSRSPSASSYVRVNGKIRAREVRVIGVDSQQIGVLTLAEAINMARANAVDLVEIAPNATPPVCRLVDYGKYRYEQSKKDKEARKHQHANKVKEVQLSPLIDPHDFGVKLQRAIDFLCDEMKVKVTLKFRGREMAHKEIGFDVVNRFLKDVGIYGHPDAAPKLLGKGINVMISPLPRNKRGKNPKPSDGAPNDSAPPGQADEPLPPHQSDRPAAHIASKPAPAAFNNNPFAKLDLDARPGEEPEQSTGS
jgi:translation initiation factor IF-3